MIKAQDKPLTGVGLVLMPVTATVGMMTGVTHNDKAEFVELRCPVVTDPLTKISKDDPKCNVPILSIAKGRSAVAAFQKKYGVLSGDTVTATFDIQASSSGRRLLAGGADGSSPFKLRPESIRVVERGEQKEFYNGTVIELHSVVYLLDFCNWTHPFRSAENAYRTCSFGKTTFHPDNVAVVGPITVDCKGQLARGVLPPVSFDGSSRCGVAEMQYWVQAAEAQAEKGDYAQDVHLYVHELQHTHGLNHASRGTQEYGDETDPMGNSPGTSQGVHCHNAPHNWRMGWATPVPGGNLNAAHLTLNANRRTFNIPASSITDQNMVIIDLGSKPGGAAAPIPYPKYFLSYRVVASTFGGYDGALKASYHQKVLIHLYNGTINDRDANLTKYIDAGPRFSGADRAFPDGNVWTAPFAPYDVSSNLGGGLRIRVVSVGSTSATVEVCRMFAQTEGVPGSPECRGSADRDW
ncbi:hypothetical protein PLESTF_001192900 [Pleodorina starrii]|nr:hypothetical protein PLESTF_001192900 [Pleodorina starrii]